MPRHHTAALWRTAAVLRVVVAALLGWLLALVGAVLAAGILSGADAAGALGVGRTVLRFTPPATLPHLTQLAPVEPASAPWAVRVARPQGAASGTIVRWAGRPWLVTAAHVVHFVPALAWLPPPIQPSPLVAISAAGRQRDLAVGRVSYWWDLAIFPFDGTAEAGLELRQEAPVVGDRMRFTGYPQGQEHPSAATGAVVAITPHASGGAAAVVVGTLPQVGQSGGALTDANGKLVGIGVATTPFGVLAVGNGAITEVIATQEQLPLAEPALPSRVLAWLLTLCTALTLTVVIDWLLRRVERP